MSTETKTASSDFQPKIGAFVCNWCTYTGADLAGTSRILMDPQVRIIRLPCTGRIDPRRMTFSWVSASEGRKWSEVVNETTQRIRELCPFQAYPRRAGK